MSINTVDNILSILDSYECSYLIDGVQCYYKSVKKHRFFKVITPFDNCSEKGVNELKEIGVLKFLILPCKEESHALALDKLELLPNISIHKHSDTSFDVTVSDVNKFIAINESCNIGSDFVFFGNDFNDLPLFENSSYSFLIGENNCLGIHANEKIEKCKIERGYTTSLINALEKISSMSGCLNA